MLRHWHPPDGSRWRCRCHHCVEPGGAPPAHHHQGETSLFAKLWCATLVMVLLELMLAQEVSQSASLCTSCCCPLMWGMSGSCHVPQSAGVDLLMSTLGQHLAGRARCTADCPALLSWGAIADERCSGQLSQAVAVRCPRQQCTAAALPQRTQRAAHPCAALWGGAPPAERW